MLKIIDDSKLKTHDEAAEHSDPVGQSTHCLQRGRDAASQGRADEAITWFHRALELRSGFSAAHAALGFLLVAVGRHAQAEVHLSAALDRMPGDAAVCNALGIAQESRNRLREAERSYRAAIAAFPEYPEAHGNLGNCLRRLGRLDEAQQHCLRAIDLKPDFAVAYYNLGAVFQDRGEYDHAIAQYRLALGYHADYIDAQSGLAGCLSKQGAVDEARLAFERLLQLRPHSIEAHWNLSQLKTYAIGDPQIDSLLAQLQRLPSLPDHGRLHYWFTAAKMLEDIGRYDESFAAYAQGNRLKRAQTPWDERAHLDVHRRIIATFTREMIARNTSGEAVEGPVPVFVVGMPRSGSSLLEQVMATLAGVHGAGEITYLPEALQQGSVDRCTGEFRFPETLGDMPGDALRRLGRHYIDRVRALAPQASHVVDKLPVNFTHVGLIHLMFPNARIVHAMRDPMDSCFSCYSLLFNDHNLGFSYDLETIARYWVSYHDMMQHWGNVLPRGRILDVSYESMVGEFANQARRVVAYLGLPWDDRCLDFHDNRRVVRTASVAQVRRPIYRTSLARWKSFERHLAPLYGIVRDYR